MHHAVEESLWVCHASCLAVRVAVQGYITSDVAAYVGPSPPTQTSFMEDASGKNLVLNVSVAFPGTADRTSQVKHHPRIDHAGFC